MTPIWSNKYRPNNLSEYIFQNKSQKQKFEECGISPKIRSEELTVENWVCLARK